MSHAERQAPVDTQSLTDTGTHVFEAIATLEYTGRKPSRSAIAAAARLDFSVLDPALTDMTRYGLLTRTEVDPEPVYVPAQRSWSTQPGQAAGHPMT